jgi:hypothetical protein
VILGKTGYSRQGFYDGINLVKNLFIALARANGTKQSGRGEQQRYYSAGHGSRRTAAIFQTTE